MAYKFLYVEWKDAIGTDGAWEQFAGLEPLDPLMVMSLGFIIEETKEYITLAMSVAVDQVCSRLTIPKPMIKYKKIITQEVLD